MVDLDSAAVFYNFLLNLFCFLLLSFYCQHLGEQVVGTSEMAYEVKVVF